VSHNKIGLSATGKSGAICSRLVGGGLRRKLAKMVKDDVVKRKRETDQEKED